MIYLHAGVCAFVPLNWATLEIGVAFVVVVAVIKVIRDLYGPIVD